MRPRGAELAGRCLLELLRQVRRTPDRDLRDDRRAAHAIGCAAIGWPLSRPDRSQGKEGARFAEAHRGHDRLCTSPLSCWTIRLVRGSRCAKARSFSKKPGLRVEGGVALVRFGCDAGFAPHARAGLPHGNRVRCLAGPDGKMDDEPKLNRNPTRWVREFPVERAAGAGRSASGASGAARHRCVSRQRPAPAATATNGRRL